MNWRSKKLTQSAKHESCVACGANDGENMITKEELIKTLNYNPITGDFTWIAKPANCINLNDIAGYTDSTGYRRIKIKSKLYSHHRLAFLYMTGRFPDEQIDHINGIKTDNRWKNLRPATFRENNANKKSKEGSFSGLKGVTYQKRRNNYRAKLTSNGVTIHLGEFKTPELAHAAYCEASKKINGEFHCDGKRQ